MSVRIIAVTNQKGGVGKTTSVLNLSAAFARKGYKTIAIDLDSQSNLTRSFLPKEPKNTLYAFFLEECGVEDVLIPVQENLVLIPCNQKFANFEGSFSNKIGAHGLLRKFIQKSLLPILSEQPNFILIDTPPALGLTTVNALTAAREIFVPMHSQEFSISALHNIAQTVAGVKEEFNPDLEIKGIFFTRHNSRKNITQQMIEVLNDEFPNKLMQTHIRVNVDLEESPSLRQDVFAYNPQSNGAKDYQALAEEIIRLN